MGSHTAKGRTSVHDADKSFDCIVQKRTGAASDGSPRFFCIAELKSLYVLSALTGLSIRLVRHAPIQLGAEDIKIALIR